MKKHFILILAILSIFMFASCDPAPVIPEEPEKASSFLKEAPQESAKGLTTTFESLTVDHYNYRITYLGSDAVHPEGETDGWVTVTTTPNEWNLYLAQGNWKFEVEAFDSNNNVISSINKEGYVNKKSDPFTEALQELMDSFTGDGIVVFKDLHLPALYADKTNFFAYYTLYKIDGSIFSEGQVPMKEVKSGDGVATLDSFQIENVPAGEYTISIVVKEMDQNTNQYEIKSGSSADGIVIYPGCKSTVTGTFGDNGAYLNATIRTFQAATTFTGKVDSSKLNVGGNNTYDNFTFTCTADSPKNIRWFVDGIEQTEITKTVKVEIMETHYYYSCPNCGATVTSGTTALGNNNNYTRCPSCRNYSTNKNFRKTMWTEDEGTGRYRDEQVTEPADGTETEFTVQLSQMGHGNSGATTHYVECIYVDVEGHISSSTQEMFVGSKYFPNLGASSIFVMGNGNEIDHWILDISPDASLAAIGFNTYSSAEGEVIVDADTGILISEGLWVVNKATAYDDKGMALIETTNATKTYINKLNPYINIENIIKSETTETGTIKITDLKMNSLDWTCNYATGHINPLRVDTDITIYKLDENGNDDSSFSPVSFHIDGCTLLETGTTVKGREGGKDYSYHNDTYQIIGASTERSAEVPEGTYRVQIEIDSGTRDQYITTYGNNYKANYAGNTKGHLEVIVNVQAHTTQTVTGTLSCNHCIKTDGTI